MSSSVKTSIAPPALAATVADPRVGADLKIVFTDLDGTFFDENHTLRKDVEKTYLQARAQGIPIIPATGRMYYMVKRMMEHGHPDFAKEFKLLPGVFGHGCVGFGKSVEDILYLNQMSREAVWKVVQTLYEYKESTYLPRTGETDQDAYFIISIYTVEKAFCDIDVPEFAKFCDAYEEWNDVFMQRRFAKADFDEISGRVKQIVGISVTSHGADILALASHLKQDGSDFIGDIAALNTRMLLPIPEQLHFLPADANKAECISVLCKQMGFKASEVLTLGDSPNDLEMIEWAGVGVAMGNAKPEVKAIANYITDKGSEGGWAKALQHLLGLHIFSSQ